MHQFDRSIYDVGCRQQTTRLVHVSSTRYDHNKSAGTEFEVYLFYYLLARRLQIII